MQGIIRNILLICACVCVCACNSRGNKQVEQAKQKFALESLLDSCLSAYPNANNNDVSRSILADTLKCKFQNFRNRHLPYIKDLPFQYEMCLEYPPRVFESFDSEIDKNAGKYVVKFAFGEISSKCKLSEHYLTTFQVFAVLDKETVATLVDGAFYYIDGVFVDFANNTQETGFILPSGKCLIDYPSVTNYDEKLYINLGTLVLDSLTFSKIEQQ